MSLSIRTSIFKSALSCSAVVLLFTGIVSAQIKTQNFTFNLPLHQLSSAGDFTVPAFDPSLGTLENLQLSVTLFGSVEQIVYNNMGKAVGFKRVTYSLPGSISGPDSLVLNAPPPTPVNPTTTLGGTRPFLPDGNPVESYTPYQTVIDESDPGVLGSWQAPGNNVVDLSYATSESPSIATDLGLPHSFSGSAKVTVAYTYDCTLATPEPPAKYLSAIVALGMIFIFLGRRKHLSA